MLMAQVSIAINEGEEYGQFVDDVSAIERKISVSEMKVERKGWAYLLD